MSAAAARSSSAVAVGGGAAAAAAGCFGRGEAAPLAAGDAGGEEARLGWRFSWSAARGEAAPPAKAESERDACRFRFLRSISMASYCCFCVLRRDADPLAESTESSGEERSR